jgi:arsenite methyltransferase
MFVATRARLPRLRDYQFRAIIDEYDRIERYERCGIAARRASGRGVSASDLPRVALAALLAALALSIPSGYAQERTRRLFPPEELGVLEGPDRDAWQKPEQVMDALGIGERSVVADVGAGGGWFTVRLARRVGPNGFVYAQDVQQQMLESIRRRVEREGFSNVVYRRGEQIDPRLPRGAFDAVLMVDTYHEFERPVELLRGVGLAIKPGGRIGIVNFRSDGGGPGPPFSERVKEERVIEQAAEAGLRLLARETFLEFQYFLIFGR